MTGAPPQVVWPTAGLAITRFAGSGSVTLTLFSVPAPMLPSVIVTVDMPPVLMVEGENALVAVNAEE